MKRTFGLFFAMCAAALMALALTPSPAVASQSHAAHAKADNFAQKLVDQTALKYSDATEIGISVRSSRGCHTVASTDAADVGEACEKEDIEPMNTGRPYVEKERDGFDVSVALHDAAGKLIGTLGVEFKPVPGQTQEQVIQRAQQISVEMAAQISSKAALLAHVK